MAELTDRFNLTSCEELTGYTFHDVIAMYEDYERMAKEIEEIRNKGRMTMADIENLDIRMAGKRSDDSAKPCPFCGSENIAYGKYEHACGTRYTILCMNCMAQIDPGWAQSWGAVQELWNRRAQPEITGETSDGYHTFNELYHHRAMLFSVICNDRPGMAWKSKRHHDGTMYDGMFIVGIETPDGQATYHYDIEPYWEVFNVQELPQAPEWDGHTPAQAIERIGKLCAQPESEPLTMDEMNALDHEPIYVLHTGGKWAMNGWHIATASSYQNHGRCDLEIDNGNTTIDMQNYGKTWLAYRTKPERSEG